MSDEEPPPGGQWLPPEHAGPPGPAPLGPAPAPGPQAPGQSAPGQPAPFHPPPGHPPPGYVVVTPKTNGMAVASLVLGILWLYWVGSILALVFGYVGRRQIREEIERTGVAPQGGGLATAGIVLGWVGVGILIAIGLVVAIAALTGTDL